MDCKPPTTDSTETPTLANNSIKPEAVPEEIPKISFKCYVCALTELCEYHGTNPPFGKKIYFTESCYVMKDPFSPAPGPNSSKTNSEYILVLGANCVMCNRMVCRGIECSLFYGRTFCLDCAKNNIKDFPLEIQTKIKKQLASITS